MEWRGDFLAEDAHSFDRFPHYYSISALSTPAPHHQQGILAFPQTLTSASLQTLERGGEGILWHTACNPSISAHQERPGCVFPQPPAVAMTGLCAGGRGEGIQADQTLVARAERISAMAGATSYAKARSSGLNQPTVAHQGPSSPLSKQLGGGGHFVLC